MTTLAVAVLAAGVILLLARRLSDVAAERDHLRTRHACVKVERDRLARVHKLDPDTDAATRFVELVAERDDAVRALQAETLLRVDAERAYSRLQAQIAGHPSALPMSAGLVDAIRASGHADDTPPHGIERPALKIVEGL